MSKAGKAFDLMGDGYARGYPGDSKLVRIFFRTPHALLRVSEESGLKINATKSVCSNYIEKGCPPIMTSLKDAIMEFVGPEPEPQKHQARQKPTPVDYGTSDILSGINLDV